MRSRTRLATAGVAVATFVGAAVVASSVLAAPSATIGPASATSSSMTLQDVWTEHAVS